MRLTAEERLEAIKNGLPSKNLIRSESKRIAYVMPQIEAALDEGISQTVIYAALKKGGLVLAESSFKSTLSRVRQRQRLTPEASQRGAEGVTEAKRSKPADDPAPPGVGEKAEKVEDDVQSFFDKIDNSVYNPDYKRGEK